MSPDRQNSNILFFLCLMTGTLALIFLPVNRVDTFPFLGNTKALSNGNVQNYLEGSSYRAPSYLVCSIDDDEDDITNHGIYHPLELAVTINKLKEIGTRHLFLGTHLHWPDLDKQENAVLNTALSELDSCIISVPLRRTASPAPLPKFLRDTSIATSQVDGSLNLLPKVNNLSLSPTFDIPDNTLAGFSQLETELPSTRLTLLAFWEDRVILSSLLLERMHHLKISPDELNVILGNSIELGNSGNIIPIDEYGYFTPTIYPDKSKPHVLSSYITGIQKSPVDTSSAILTAEGLQADTYRAIRQPAIQLQQLTLTPVRKEILESKRLHFFINLIALIAVTYLLGYTSPLPTTKYLICLTLLSIFWISVAMILVRNSGFYLPLTHLATAILTGFLSYFILKRRAHLIYADKDEFIDFDSVAEAFTASQRATEEAKIAKANYKQLLKKQKQERKLKKRQDKAQKRENTYESEIPSKASDTPNGDIYTDSKETPPSQSDNE